MYEFCTETLACCLLQGVDTPRIDNMERRVTTPRIVHSGESLMTAEDFFRTILKYSACLQRKLKQKIDYECRALLTRK
jgi:hypothetical protein